jgi:chromosome segregation ATPase
VAGLTSQLAAAREEAGEWKLKCDAVAAERAALENELQVTKANLDDAMNQLRDDAEAFTKRVQGLNERAAQLRDTCDNQQAQLDALREEVKEKEVRVKV